MNVLEAFSIKIPRYVSLPFTHATGPTNLKLLDTKVDI
jgi:hypothetical protein